MEFKDKLKNLRKERGMSQSELAQAIYVSRSAVAKWENGLGLPNPDAMAALEELFGISRDEVATSEPETVIIAKNRKLYLLKEVVLWTLMLALAVITAILPFAIHKGNYGFTAEMAAGVFADKPYIDTGDYRIYYSTFSGDWEDSRHWEILSSWKPVRKHFWGWTVSKEDYEYRVITLNNYVVGRLYSIKGTNGYYHLLSSSISQNRPDELVTLREIWTSGQTYEVQHGFFFMTPEPVKAFFVGDTFYDVE